MPFYLKKDLPTIKAGTEMEKIGGFEGGWIVVDKTISQFWQIFPPEVLNDWIEERDGKWKPQEGQRYFSSCFRWIDTHVDSYYWNDAESDKRLFSLGLCFRTEEEAHQAALQMLGALKK